MRITLLLAALFARSGPVSEEQRARIGALDSRPR